MTVESFDEETILSVEDLIERLHRHVDKTFSEIKRRFERERDHDKAVSELKPTTRQIFDVLKESGGLQRFIDIQRFVGCSSSTLTNALSELIEKGLVRSERGFYQAASPAWFAQKKLEQKKKTKETSI